MRKHKPGFKCPSKCFQKWFDCNKAGHFKGAPICKKPKDKKSKGKKLPSKAKREDKDKNNRSSRVNDKESSEDSTDYTDDELTDSCGKVHEMVG